MPSSRNWTLLPLATFFLILSALCLWGAGNSYKKRFTPVNELVVSNHFMADLGGLFLGSRRGAADLAYIQLLQYYSAGLGSIMLHPHNDDDDAEDEKNPFTKRWEPLDPGYHKLKPYGERLVRLDSYFNSAILEVCGALAFIENRVTEALDLLKEAIDRDPSYFRYRIYVGGIIYKFRGEDQSLIRNLESVANDRDCPPLLLSILANLYRKNGDFKKAADLYANAVKNNPSRDFRHDAAIKLSELLAKHPELAH